MNAENPGTPPCPRPALRLGAIPGATPDKWAARWRSRYPELELGVDYFDESGQLERVERGTVDIGYVRFAEDCENNIFSPDYDGASAPFHRVQLYREDPVVCAARDHWIAAAEESVLLEEIAEESFIDPAAMLRDWSAEGASVEDPSAQGASVKGAPAHDLSGQGARSATDGLAEAERMAMEVAASGAGILMLPNSVARMLSRKDIVIRRVEGAPGYDVGLAWLKKNDGSLIQEFIGIARGRKASSSRSALAEQDQDAEGQGNSSQAGAEGSSKGGRGAGKPPGKRSATRGASRGGPAQRQRRPRPGSRRAQPPRGRRRRR